MYRCESCRQVQPAGTPSVLVPVQTRAVTYPFRKDAHPSLPTRTSKGKRIRRPERRPDPGGTGIETVLAVRCCILCAARLREQGRPLSMTG